jgi:hypothetical protein
MAKITMQRCHGDSDLDDLRSRIEGLADCVYDKIGSLGIGTVTRRFAKRAGRSSESATTRRTCPSGFAPVNVAAPSGKARKQDRTILRGLFERD